MGLPEALVSFTAANPSVWFVRLQWLDLSGILRCRIFTKEHCEALASAGKSLSLAPLSMTCMVDGSTLDTYEASGTNRLWPEWTSLRMTNFSPDQHGEFHYATVMCLLEESSPLYPHMGAARCPRSILYRVLHKAEEQFGLTFLVGFEVEFIIAKRTPTGDAVAAEVNCGRNSVAGCQARTFSYVEESVRELQAIGVAVEQFHAEGSFGQFEISTGPLRPMDAVDAYLSTRDAIKNVSARHGMLASMHPKLLDSHPATGTHAHISLNPADKETSFIAGILGRLPALCAFSMANIDSYLRTAEAGAWVSWGTQSRDVPLRKVSPGHWEIRSADTTANPYLFLAAFIGAGLLGIKASQRLSWKDSRRWFSEMNAGERRALHVDTPMPGSLLEALSCLEDESHGLDQVLGEDIIPQYAHLKREEHDMVKGWGLEKRRRVFSEYF